MTTYSSKLLAPQTLFNTTTNNTLLQQRERAWQIFPYPCIGLVRFLDFTLSTMPSYSNILSSLSRKDDPTTLLDVGCCVGQDLRKLVVDGAPGSQLAGVELEAEYIELGYGLFLDRGRFECHFVVGDVFDHIAMKNLHGKFDFVHAASFLHLWAWDGQIDAGSQLVQFLKDKAGTVILGRQVGNSTPGEYPQPVTANGVNYLHDTYTFEKMWNEIGERTKTKWKVEASMRRAVAGRSTVELLFFEATRVE